METLIGADDGTPMERLARIAALRRDLARAEAAEVRHARQCGMSWAEIGVILGVSKQAMHKKYGRKS
jgi:hypothetical protein